MTKPLVIVIGAGVSGLSCACELVKAGVPVLVLEARNRIGGRTHTVDSSLGAPMDLGASFIHGLAGNPLHSIAKERGLRLYQAGGPEQQKSYIYSPEGPPLSQQVADRLSFNSLRTLFSSSEEYSQEGKHYPAATDSLATYILDPSISTLFDGLEGEKERSYARAMSESWDGWMGAELKDVSLRYWQSDVTYSGPDATVIDGYRDIYQPLADQIGASGSEIRLNEKVVAVRLSEDGDTVQVETTDSSSTSSATSSHYMASFCVSTLPLGVLKKAPPQFSPPFSTRRQAAIDRLGFGLLNKVILTYEACFWPKDQSFITLLPSKVSAGFLPILQNRALFAQNYLPVTGRNTLVFYCGATFGSALEKLSDQQVSDGFHAILAHHFHDANFPNSPASCIVTRWEQDPYSYGSYAYMRPAKAGETDGPTPYDFAELARPAWGDRLFFAGEATDPDHYATVHGPLITGRREAQRILDAIEAAKMEA